VDSGARKLMSAGRANLHQGAVGVGIDLSTGRTLKAVWKNRPALSHPDTAAPLKSIQMPHWHEILLNMVFFPETRSFFF